MPRPFNAATAVVLTSLSVVVLAGARTHAEAESLASKNPPINSQDGAAAGSASPTLDEQWHSEADNIDDAADSQSSHWYSLCCTNTYEDGSTESVRSCDTSQCLDVTQLQACASDDPPDDVDCNALVNCSCECYDGTEVTEFETSRNDGIFLTGIPDLWQFDYMCTFNGSPNAVGCGPVAAASLLYWYSQQGYTGLTQDHLNASGFHKWKQLVKELRREHASGGICIDGQYATPQGIMAEGLNDYVEDAGYNATIGHYKVCNNCAARENDELASTDGLEFVKSELAEGRPLILGFNVARTLDSFVEEDGETVYTGKLSNGTPLFGIISHYAVITGYRENSEGRKLLYLNLGWDEDPDGVPWLPDVAVEWNPGGKWMHLYSMSLWGQPDGPDECFLDNALDRYLVATRNVELSHETRTASNATLQFTPLAGRNCGLAEGGSEVTYYPVVREDNDCITLSDLPTLEETYEHMPDNIMPGGGEPLDPVGPGTPGP